MLVIDCSIMGGGATVWQGAAFECAGSNIITLRHTDFRGLQKSCNNGVIVAKAIGIVNNTFISQLNIMVSPEMNNTTVECRYDRNLTTIVIKSINIIVLSNMSLNPFPVNAQLSNVSLGELTFNWNPNIDYCSFFQFFIESGRACGDCPQVTYNNFVTCQNVTINKTCSFTVGTKTSDDLWEDQSLTINVLLRGKIRINCKDYTIIFVHIIH